MADDAWDAADDLDDLEDDTDDETDERADDALDVMDDTTLLAALFIDMVPWAPLLVAVD